jgi:AcrR family transcriptional regulator
MSSKDRILQAAERIVLRDGVAHLTLEAVAAEAGLSKGGVLYNFPSKDDLVRGMISRLIETYESRMRRLFEQDPEPVGRRLRAFLNASFPEPDQEYRRSLQVSAALLAAVSTNPAMLAPVQEQFRKWQEWIREDGLDLVNGAIVRLAAEGLWLADLFGLAELEPDLRRRVLERLRELTRQQGGAATEDAETGLVVDRAGGGAGGGAGEPGPGGA